MTVLLNNDVPAALIGLVSEIDYRMLTAEQGEAALRELADYLERSGYVKRRTMPGSPVPQRIDDHVPEVVVRFLNSYDYTHLKGWQIKAALPFVRAELRKRGLLN